MIRKVLWLGEVSDDPSVPEKGYLKGLVTGQWMVIRWVCPMAFEKVLVSAYMMVVL